MYQDSCNNMYNCCIVRTSTLSLSPVYGSYNKKLLPIKKNQLANEVNLTLQNIY